MAEAYNDLVVKILRWSNRDPEIFGATVDLTAGTVTDPGLIADFMTYAADKTYRILRIPPLEKTIIYNPQSAFDVDTGEETNPMIVGNCLPVPADLIEFIHIRAVDAFGTGNSIVYNQKADTRTFHDFDSEKYDPRYTWTRQGNQILVPNSPGIQAGCTYEVFYYGRLGRLNATYDVSAFNANLLPFDGTATNGILTASTAEGSVGLWTVSGDDGTYFDTEEEAEAGGGTAAEVFFLGEAAPNWLRDENERIILFGALAELFSFVGEDDMMQKFEAKFGEEITTLNKEEEMRHASGGNVQINFNGRGLI